MLEILRDATRSGLGALGLVGLLATTVAAQGRAPARRAPAATQAPAGANEGAAVVEMKRVPASPSDPVAIVNGETITRQELADEAISMKGKEVLDAMVARKLIDQALKTGKVSVSESEIYDEIDRVAQAVAGVSREQWLRTLAKDREISPAQYARDVIYPALALRKLAEPRVQITPEDVKDAYEAEFGDQLVYRMILTRSLDHAKLVWESLRANPGSFEKVARDDPRSIDPATRASGGKPANGPLQRHSFPREVTDRIFAELVDGDPGDTDPTHKPKDGQVSGPIQVTEDSWLIVLRESVIPARPYDKDDPALKSRITDAIKESKLQQAMENVYSAILAEAAVENRLAGSVQVPQSEFEAVNVDGMIRRTEADQTAPAPAAPPAASGAERTKLPPPASIPASEVETVERLKKSTEVSPKD